MAATVLLKQNPHSTENPFMGMENYGMAMWSGTTVFFDTPQKNGKYVHGLKPEEVQELNSIFNVDFDGESGQEFLENFQVKIPATITALDLSKAEDLLSLRILQATGNFIAPHKAAANQGNVNYSFYIQNVEEEAKENNKVIRVTNNAIAKMDSLSISNPEYFIAVCKYVLPETAGVGTNVDIAYQLINDYIKSSLESAERFLNTIDEEKTSKHLVYVTNDIKTAILKNIIRKNKKGYLYNPLTNTEYGKNLEEAINFLMDPKNLDELGTGDNDDANYSVKYQLKFK